MRLVFSHTTSRPVSGDKMHTIGTWWMWVGFGVFIVLATIVDLYSLRAQGAHKVSFREAFRWSLLWVSLALIFNALLWWYLDDTAGRAIANTKSAEFFAGYVIEKSLSVDNIFVFLMIFNYFNVPAEYQKKVLVAGVILAVVLRVILILVGAILIERFDWILYVFGAFLLYSGFKMIKGQSETIDFDNNPVLRFVRRNFRVIRTFYGERLTIVRGGKRYGTILVLVLAMIGVTDVIFAVDSIPAIFAVTKDPFIVMTSNIFAVLGLRALYFMLAKMADKFHLLSFALALILMFVGVKMLIVEFYHMPIGISLAVILTLLISSILASIWLPNKQNN